MAECWAAKMVDVAVQDDRLVGSQDGRLVGSRDGRLVVIQGG